MENASKTAIITGASQGIGFATANLFLERGWKIITCSRSTPVQEVVNEPNWLAHIKTDLAIETSLDDFIKEASEIIGDGTLQALVNNAGQSPKSINKERLGCLNGETSAWKNVFDLNLFAPLSLGRGFASFLAKGKGSVVNVTSIAGHQVHPFAGSAYSSSKAALSALTREMANEFAALDVRVNAVAPGEISTNMVQPEYEMLIPRIPLNRIGEPMDVASLIYFLCSKEAGYITGSEIWVTGGQHML
ncbi:MAG: SDR family oxidoreductase [Pseudomonadota bacterium]|nr:SDR family oxidoreductase [Pseudomonadota bacterium]